MAIEETRQRINELLRENERLRAIVDELTEAAENVLLLHTLEHEARGSGRVIDVARAKSTPCKCFRFEEEEYCWSPGILGLMSSKKNPQQIASYCVVGKEPAGEGAKKRFKEIKGAIGEAHKVWKAKGGGLPEWWEEVGAKLEEKGLEL